MKESINEQIREQIENTIMSEELKNWEVKVLWNDCEVYSKTPFNIVALQWRQWGGYNTSRVKEE